MARTMKKRDTQPSWEYGHVPGGASQHQTHLVFANVVGPWCLFEQSPFRGRLLLVVDVDVSRRTSYPPHRWAQFGGGLFRTSDQSIRMTVYPGTGVQ